MTWQGHVRSCYCLKKKTHSVGIIMSQESVFLMVKYKILIAVCGFTSKLFRFVSVSVGSHAVSAGRQRKALVWKSSGSPEKQVSQLFISCQVLGFRTGMWAVCKGCWER